MGKIIINNLADIPDIDALNLVRDVITMGRISNGNTQYCYLSCISPAWSDKEYHIASDLNKCSDKFTIYNQTS
jgi:hypothetical protein